MRLSSFVAAAACAGLVALSLGLSSGGCTTKEPTQSTYFDRTISPILTTSCVRTNTGAGCHVATDKGNSLGNLDLATFDGVNHRRDLLADYGPYGQPAMLVKNVPPFQVQVQSFDGTKVTITTDIKHAGGPILDPTASAYQTLRRWIENGATANNTGAAVPTLQRQHCKTDVPAAPGFDPTKDPATADYQTFQSRVLPTFGTTCAAGNCHGSAANDLYLTCGDTPEQARWNYFAASDYLAQTAEQSEIVRRPLAPSQGGSFHEGGIIFQTVGDDGYQGLLEWAKAHGPLAKQNLDPVVLFFADKVQPMLVKKGCMMLQCHSAAMFHDYRLRGGSGGSFSLSATRRNYNFTVAQMSFESADPNASRLVRKNLFRPELGAGSEGLAHRGGPLLEDFPGKPASAALCDAGAYDYDNGNLDAIPAYCVIREWLLRERAARKLAPLSGIVYVRRPISTGPDRPQDFDVFQGGAELHITAATLNAAGDVQAGADAKVDLTACGLVGSPDIRRPAVSWDAKTIAFAARATQNDALQIYTINADGTGCAAHAGINAAPPGDTNGLAIHNFDPQYSPPDANGVVRIVFASTRGLDKTKPLASANFDYAGPQRTPADPSKPNANLHVFEPDPANPAATRIRQLTFQLNMERFPSFMADGRLILTTEKREPGFYQLALRRMNLDGGDYHPLYAQRGTIGYYQATYAVELGDKNFATIFSDPPMPAFNGQAASSGTPHGGGALAIFNRSIGLDFTSGKASDYVIDGSVIDPAAPSSPEPNFFLHSLRLPDGSVSGHPGSATTGLYTSPAALPGGKVLVSFGASADVTSFGGDYDVYVLDPVSGAKTKLFGNAGTAEIEAVAIYERTPKGIFSSTHDEPNGTTQVFDGKTEADITVLDFPVLASLLFQNTPTGRPIDTGITSFDVFEELPPPPTLTAFGNDPNVSAPDAFGQVYVRRRLLGNVPLATDGSAHFVIPGGVPIVLHLPDTDASRRGGFPRYQREEMSFSPGEYAHQSFPRAFFNGLCGQCHGAISGRPVDAAVQPDILTQASNVIASGIPAAVLNIQPSQRGQQVGPPSSP